MKHKLDVLVVLQSHAKNNGIERYVQDTKLELAKRSLLSLVNTMNHCIAICTEADINFNLVILDDRSDFEFIDFVNLVKDKTSFDIELVPSIVPGMIPNILYQYQIGKERGKDLIFFANDDYLYFDSAMYEMIDSHFKFTEITKSEVCIFPFDDPYRYGEQYFNYPSKVFLGKNRHWRIAHHTAVCCLMSYKTLVENWDLFKDFDKFGYDNEFEDKSINRLFQNIETLPKRNITHLLFTPIPSLALHMNGEFEKDPFIDWKPLWDKFSLANFDLTTQEHS